jgi:hypothetical protein
VYWCFHCYALDDYPVGPCIACGEPIEAPAGLSAADGLIWTLRHPDGDRAVLAATLGRLRARESAPALRQAVESGADVYLKAAVLRSLILIEGVEPLSRWLDELSRIAPINVRAIARNALEAGDAE